MKVLRDTVATGLFLPHLQLLLQQDTGLLLQQETVPTVAEQQPMLLYLPPTQAHGALPLLELTRETGAPTGEGQKGQETFSAAAEILGVVAPTQWRELSQICDITRGAAEAAKRRTEANKLAYRDGNRSDIGR